MLWGRCLSYGEGITYWPVEEMLEGAAGILKSDDAETVSREARRAARPLRARATPTSSARSPRRSRTSSARRRTPRRRRRPRSRRPSSTGASAACSSCWPRRGRCVLVFEDLHWAEPTLFDLIEFIGEAAAPILVLGSARPRAARAPARALRRRRAARDDRALRARRGARARRCSPSCSATATLPPGSRAEALLRNAAGNPLFLEETVRMLDDAGVLDGDGRPRRRSRCRRACRR